MLFDIKKNLEKIALSLSNETRANENMLHAYFDYLETGDEDALDSANTQFRENLKSAGLGILLIIPFSPVTIPFFIRLAKKHQVDIIPNWYKKLDLNNDENKLE